VICSSCKQRPFSFGAVIGRLIGGDTGKAKDGQVVGEVGSVPAPNNFQDCNDAPVGDTDVPVVETHVEVPFVGCAVGPCCSKMVA
jgi:hypothetical protein